MIPICLASVTNAPSELSDDDQSTCCLLFFLLRHGNCLCCDNARASTMSLRVRSECGVVTTADVAVVLFSVLIIVSVYVIQMKQEYYKHANRNR